MSKQDHAPNTTILQICGIMGIDALLLTSQFRWIGHIFHKWTTVEFQNWLFTARWKMAIHSQVGQMKRFEDMLKLNFRAFSFPPEQLESFAQDRSSWRSRCWNFISTFEAQRVNSLKEKHQLCKDSTLLDAWERTVARASSPVDHITLPSLSLDATEAASDWFLLFRASDFFDDDATLLEIEWMLLWSNLVKIWARLLK